MGYTPTGWIANSSHCHACANKMARLQRHESQHARRLRVLSFHLDSEHTIGHSYVAERFDVTHTFFICDVRAGEASCQSVPHPIFIFVFVFIPLTIYYSSILPQLKISFGNTPCILACAPNNQGKGYGV